MLASPRQPDSPQQPPELPPDTLPCTTCGGTGLVENPIYDGYGNIAHAVNDTCPRCGGTGKEEPGGPG